MPFPSAKHPHFTQAEMVAAAQRGLGMEEMTRQISHMNDLLAASAGLSSNMLANAANASPPLTATGVMMRQQAMQADPNAIGQLNAEQLQAYRDMLNGAVLRNPYANQRHLGDDSYDTRALPPEEAAAQASREKDWEEEFEKEFELLADSIESERSDRARLARIARHHIEMGLWDIRHRAYYTCYDLDVTTLAKVYEEHDPTEGARLPDDHRNTMQLIAFRALIMPAPGAGPNNHIIDAATAEGDHMVAVYDCQVVPEDGSPMPPVPNRRHAMYGRENKSHAEIAVGPLLTLAVKDCVWARPDYTSPHVRPTAQGVIGVMFDGNVDRDTARGLYQRVRMTQERAKYDSEQRLNHYTLRDNGLTDTERMNQLAQLAGLMGQAGGAAGAHSHQIVGQGGVGVVGSHTHQPSQGIAAQYGQQVGSAPFQQHAQDALRYAQAMDSALGPVQGPVQGAARRGTTPGSVLNSLGHLLGIVKNTP